MADPEFPVGCQHKKGSANLLKHSRLSKKYIIYQPIETLKIVKGIYNMKSVSYLKVWSDIVQRDIGRGHDKRLYLKGQQNEFDKSHLELE